MPMLRGLGTDPKSVLCMYFKQGLCTKGAKCKFSHDLAIERKAEKRSLYDEIRENGNKENGSLLKQETLAGRRRHSVFRHNGQLGRCSVSRGRGATARRGQQDEIWYSDRK